MPGHPICSVTSNTGCSADELAVLRVVDAGPQPEDLVQREARLERGPFARALLALSDRGLVQLLPGGFIAGVSNGVPFTNKATNENLSGKFGAQFDLSRNSMVYATYARG